MANLSGAESQIPIRGRIGSWHKEPESFSYSIDLGLGVCPEMNRNSINPIAPLNLHERFHGKFNAVIISCSLFDFLCPTKVTDFAN